jgi:hypothetical protein
LFSQGFRKAPDKVNKRAINPKGPLTIRIGNRVKRRAVIATICIIVVAILGTIISSRTVAYANSIRGMGVGIYWDQECTNRTLSLDWGLIEPGTNTTMIVYVKNEGDSAVSLWMATTNWKPSVSLGYMTLSWTYSGGIISANEVIPIDLILNVSPTVSGITDFSFDTVITATG